MQYLLRDVDLRPVLGVVRWSTGEEMRPEDDNNFF